LNDFTSGNAARQILLFSLPMLVGNLFQQIYSMADAVVVGRYVSGASLAAIGVSMNLLFFLISVLMGLTTGASVVISQFFGAGRHDSVRRTVSTSVIFLSALSAVITVLGVLFAPFLIGLLKAPPEIFSDAVLYFRILMGGTVFLVFFNMYTAYLRALGDSRSPLYILIFCTLLNIGLDLLFVLRFGLGVAGVASATVISQALSAVLCFLYAKYRVPLLSAKEMAFDGTLLKAILKYGFPAAIQLSLVTLANLSITRLINSFGPAAIAGITAAARIDQLAIMPVSNLSMALSTFVAQNMGAGKEDRAKQGFRHVLVYMLVVSVAISALLIAFGPQLVSLFLNEGEALTADILRVGLKDLNILVLFYFFFAFLFAFNGFFRGVGDAVIAMVFPVSSLALRAASAYALVEYAAMGPEALAWSIPVGWGLCSLASWVYYKKRLWAGKVIARPTAQAR
jgi:putative MATE family efflux protein